jgi:sulfate transport system ATP-binding protein
MSIVLEHLVKYFDRCPAVNDVSVEVAEGEFFVLLGPSGSGKSTILRMIAGLGEIDSGRILLRGKDVTGLPPQRRGVGFVFQHYALFRHLSVARNVEFPLEIRRVRAAERRRRRDELLELVGLVGLEGRLPGQLSGGQQQRVALARALAHRPDVLLLDEPFGALDAKIRLELRRSVRRIQRELGVTTIFVTHDQDEAFELADRVGVMNFGRLLELGPPRELYLHPQTEFVATFLGKANLMVGRCDRTSVTLGPVRIPLDRHVTSVSEDRRVQVLFRPEDVAVADSPSGLDSPLLGKAIVDEADFSGATEKLRLKLPALDGVRTISPEVPFGADHILIEAARSQYHGRRFPLCPGDTAWIGVRRIHALLHPGLSFLVVADGSDQTEGPVEFAGQIARLAHARVHVLAAGLPPERAGVWLQQAREFMGSGPATLEFSAERDGEEGMELEARRRPYDLVIRGRQARGESEIAERVLAAGEHNLLLVAPRAVVPRRALICVAVGEPGKEDVLFAGRLMRHLGAAATILTVQAENCGEELLEHGRRFLTAGAHTLGLLGVDAVTKQRAGRALPEILAELREGDYDLLIVGAPLVPGGRRFSLRGLVRDLLREVKDLPILIVRSHLEMLETRST